jgi:hypothetical protein
MRMREPKPRRLRNRTRGEIADADGGQEGVEEETVEEETAEEGGVVSVTKPRPQASLRRRRTRIKWKRESD